MDKETIGICLAYVAYVILFVAIGVVLEWPLAAVLFLTILFTRKLDSLVILLPHVLVWILGFYSIQQLFGSLWMVMGLVIMIILARIAFGEIF